MIMEPTIAGDSWVTQATYYRQLANHKQFLYDGVLKAESYYTFTLLLVEEFESLHKLAITHCDFFNKLF